MYQAAGYGHGHRVASLLENRPSFFVHWLALKALGISAVPINPDSTVPEATAPARSDPPSQLTEAALLFTSGTSGASKGANLTNEGFLFNAERYIMAGGLMRLEYGTERLYNPLPLFYANALAHSNVVMILLAGCMVVPERFSARTWWHDLVQTRATCLHHLGIIAPALLGRAPVPEERMHRAKFGLGGGIDPTQQLEWSAGSASRSSRSTA